MTIEHPWLKGMDLPPTDAPLSPEAAVGYLATLNEKDQEELSPYVVNRLQRFERFEKQWLPFSYFRTEEWREPVSDSLVARYQAEPADTAPPILVEGVEHAIIDGFHRFNAAQQRGDTGIWAYVGCEPRPDWRPISPDAEAAPILPPARRRRLR